MASSLLNYVREFGPLKGLDIYRKAKFGHGEHMIEVPGLRAPIVLRARTSDRPTFCKIFVEHEYALDFKGEARLIIDGGANVGYGALYLSQRHPGATVIAIEPEVENFEVLGRNTAAYPNIRCVNKGLWHRDTYLAIENPTAEPHAFRVRETDQPDGAIEATTIGTILRESGAEVIDILKLDVEGAEKEIFSAPDCHDWLARTRVLVVELHDRFKPGCTEAFEQAVAPHAFRRIQAGENLILMRDQARGGPA